MSPTFNIRATHHHGFRFGYEQPWGVVIGVEWKSGRPCYIVAFADDDFITVDHWPVYDPSDPYEFKQIPR